jgi:hypothetical protein
MVQRSETELRVSLEGVVYRRVQAGPGSMLVLEGCCEIVSQPHCVKRGLDAFRSELAYSIGGRVAMLLGITSDHHNHHWEQHPHIQLHFQ